MEYIGLYLKAPSIFMDVLKKIWNLIQYPDCCIFRLFKTRKVDIYKV